MRGQADAAEVRLTCSVEPATPAVRANPEKLQRVLFNLIDNALRHTPSDGSVSIEASAGDGGWVEVTVSDTGEGIAEADRARVFEPFFRGGPATSCPRNGAGLGLPICRAIVQAHGGEIELVDTPSGSRVRFTVPAFDASATGPATSREGLRRDAVNGS